MANGFFQDEHGDKSASRLMAFIALLALVAWGTKLVWNGTAIPEIPWPWIALPIVIYLVGKMGQATIDAIGLTFIGRVGGQPPAGGSKP